MAIIRTNRPIAETFYVSSEQNPQGVYISSVDLCFQSIETSRNLPVVVEIRPTENGIPVTKKLSLTRSVFDMVVYIGMVVVAEENLEEIFMRSPQTNFRIFQIRLYFLDFLFPILFT